MKIEIEILDEDIEKLEVLLRDNPDLAKFVSFNDVRKDLKLILEAIGKQSVKKLHEGLLAIKSGVIPPDEFLGRMFLEGIKFGLEMREIENKKGNERRIE